MSLTIIMQAQGTTDEELVELAAMKLDSNYHEISRFTASCKPINENIDHYTKRLLSITEEYFEDAKEFNEIIYEFINWIGFDNLNDVQFVTFGSFTFRMLKKNCDLHFNIHQWEYPYFDLQKALSPIGADLSLEKILLDYNISLIGIRRIAECDVENIYNILMKYSELGNKVVNNDKDRKFNFVYSRRRRVQWLKKCIYFLMKSEKSLDWNTVINSPEWKRISVRFADSSVEMLFRQDYTEIVNNSLWYKKTAHKLSHKRIK